MRLNKLRLERDITHDRERKGRILGGRSNKSSIYRTPPLKLRKHNMR